MTDRERVLEALRLFGEVERLAAELRAHAGPSRESTIGTRPTLAALAHELKRRREELRPGDRVDAETRAGLDRAARDLQEVVGALRARLAKRAEQRGTGGRVAPDPEDGVR